MKNDSGYSSSQGGGYNNGYSSSQTAPTYPSQYSSYSSYAAPTAYTQTPSNFFSGTGTPYRSHGHHHGTQHVEYSDTGCCKII